MYWIGFGVYWIGCVYGEGKDGEEEEAEVNLIRLLCMYVTKERRTPNLNFFHHSHISLII